MFAGARPSVGPMCASFVHGLVTEHSVCTGCACRGPCDAASELLCDHCSQPKATNSLLQQWEQQVTRRSIQHQLKLQRQQMTDEGQQSPDDDQQAAAAEEIVQAADGEVVTQQQPVLKPRPGVWGSARAHTAASTTTVRYSCQTTQLPCEGKGGVCQSSVLKDCSCSTTSTASAITVPCAGDESLQPVAGSVAGVKAPHVAPSLRPQLSRKRPGCKGVPAGGFKAPRITRTAAENSSKKILVPEDCSIDGSTERMKAAVAVMQADGNNSDSTQLQQAPSAIDVTAQSSPLHTAEPQAVASVEIAPAVSAPVVRTTRGLGRAGRGRHAFVPPLKKT